MDHHTTHGTLHSNYLPSSKSAGAGSTHILYTIGSEPGYFPLTAAQNKPAAPIWMPAITAKATL